MATDRHDLDIYESQDKTWPVNITQTESGTARAGASTTITLASISSAVDDFYNDKVITLTGGTGQGQTNIITDYNGTTKVATVSTWDSNPDVTTKYSISGIVVDITGYTFLFTVKEKKGDTDANAIIKKEITSHSDPTNGVTQITIDSADTIDMEGVYWYDYQWVDTSTKRRPVLKAASFTVEQRIGDTFS